MWTVKWFGKPWSTEIPALMRLQTYESLIVDILPMFKSRSFAEIRTGDQRALCNKVSPWL